MTDQLRLFSVPPASGSVAIEPIVSDEDRETAARLPAFVRFGTSSWSFPGWANIVYRSEHTEAELARSGLTAYAQQPLLRAVSLDRSYYAPLREEDLGLYAAQLGVAAGRTAGLPPFRMLSKVWEELTTAVFPKHARYGARAGTPNPMFLDGKAFASEILAPYQRVFESYCGPFVFELTPMPPGAMDDRALAAKIDAFARDLPPGFRFAFELRNAELFGARWLDALRANGAAHVFNYWTAMPSLRAQLVAGKHDPSLIVVRLMLPPFTKYAAKKAEFAPFNRIAEPQAEMRDDVVHVVRAALAAGCEEAFVLVNNKAEGSAPLTIRAIANRVAREL